MVNVFKSLRKNKEPLINTQDATSKFEKIKIESKSKDINIYEVVKKEFCTMKDLQNNIINHKANNYIINCQERIIDISKIQ